MTFFAADPAFRHFTSTLFRFNLRGIDAPLTSPALSAGSDRAGFVGTGHTLFLSRLQEVDLTQLASFIKRHPSALGPPSALLLLAAVAFLAMAAGGDNAASVGLLGMLFGVSALMFIWLVIGVYLSQSRGATAWVRFFGSGSLSLALPLALVALYQEAEPWVGLHLGIVLAYILVEFLLDYILKIDFRSKPRLHVPYIMLFYAALYALIRIGFFVSSSLGWLLSISFWLLLACLTYMLIKGRRDNQG